MLQPPVYLDNHATTQPDPRVLEAMWPYFTTKYGNAASLSHRHGWEASEALEAAREQAAALLGAEAREIVFTSGATEANNLAIKGVLAALKTRGHHHIVTAATEHRAVLDVCKRLAREGRELTILPPNADGLITAEAVASACHDRTALVSIMAANNEVGTLNPIAEIGAVCRERGIVFHTDATQAVGKVPLDVVSSCVDLLSLSSHKMHGPKGIGALYVRSGLSRRRLAPLFDGGGQERGLRSGTVAVPLAVGLGVAAELAGKEREAEAVRVARLRDRLREGLFSRLDGLILNGHPTLRLPGNLHLSFEGVDGEALMMNMREIAVSSGAACSSANPEPSHVLRALGMSEALSRASLRFGLGRFTTEEEVDFAAEHVATTVTRLRAREAARTVGV